MALALQNVLPDCIIVLDQSYGLSNDEAHTEYLQKQLIRLPEFSVAHP